MINCRFEILKQIGKGRSEVFLCKDIDFDGREVAVKFLPPNANEEELKYFRDEFFTLRKLDHPNIIKAFEIGEVVIVDQDDPIQVGSNFILLEYFESTELISFGELKEENKLKEILKQLCSVLYYLHQSNYIYYDLKPENILVSVNLNSTRLKLIDLGLAEYLPNQNEHVIKGTAQYIAPELLKKEPHDFRVDLYSLGIILYQIIYDQLPFDNSDELKIYKAQVEEEFNFPESSQFSSGLIEIVKKLLEKDPGKRYRDALQVISDLGFEIDASIYHNFVPAKVFSGRQDFINILTAFINDKKSSEVFSVKGFDSAGKSALLNKMYEVITNSILISNTQGISGINLIKHFIKRMIFNGSVFFNLNDNEKEHILSFITKSEKDYLDELHSIVSIITNRSQFVVLIDDYNLFDSLAKEVISELIPIFQVNGLKVIISEASDFDYASDNINNLREVLVGSFTQRQLNDYLDLAFYDLFPREDVSDLILRFADLLPGNVIDFIKDLINLQIIVFDMDGVTINENLEKISGIEGSMSGIYDLRLSNLKPDDIGSAKVISAFEGSVEQNSLSRLLNINRTKLDEILSNLQINNVIQPFGANTVPVIASDGLKKHIYSLIDNKVELHAALAESIATKLPGFRRNEFARQYELAGNFEKAYLIWNEEIDSAQKLSAYSYIKSILLHLLELPLTDIIKNDVNYKLAETLYKISDYNTAINIIEQIEIEPLPKDKLLELYIMKGSAMINSSRIEEGKELIKSLIPKVENENRKSKLLVEIAYAKFDLNLFEEAAEMCNEILEREQVTDEDKGRLYNLLGMYYHFSKNDSRSSLIQFEKAFSYFEKEGLLSKVASVELNIGIMNNIIGNKDLAEASWKKALNINRSIGNLAQEGLLLLNNGVHYFENINFVVAIDYYKRAHNIFLSLGHKVNEGLALSNLGEVYFITCEYQNSFEVLEEAKIILGESDNLEEFIPVLVLLAHFHFTIGNIKDLTNLNNETLKLSKYTEVKKNYKSEIMLLNNLSLIATGKEIQIEDLKIIRDEYLGKEDLKNYVTVNLILLNYLLKSKKFSEATNELNKLRFVEVCEANNIYNASREYLLGKVSSLNGHNDSSSSIEHYEKAYELLSDESIVELTWKVLFALAESYTKRGNFNKAKNFIIYTRDLIYLIAENIETTHFKTAYLQKEERREAIEILEKLHNV
ncbi:MAG: serine/threonine protein kinase [Ignavibacteria bacterium]|nr:MAG: serine/threonine protein kinase [Ignavibacteria bacterium]